MSTREADLERECELRFIELCVANLGKSPPQGIDLYVEGFWAGVEASQQPLDADALAARISVSRARAAGLIR